MELKFFYLTFLVLLFHVTRNISLIGYVIILGISYFGLYYYMLKNKTYKKKIAGFELVFLLMYCFIPVISVFNLNASDLFTGLTRYLVTFPFVVYIFISKSMININKIYKILLIFISLCGLSLIYQVLFGEIWFFAEPYTRDGLIRYASLAGSLTAYGTIGAFGLVIALNFKNMNNNFKIISTILIVSGLLVSQQKSALINLILVIVLSITALIIEKTKVKDGFKLKMFKVNKNNVLLSTITLISGIIFLILFGDYLYSILNYTFNSNLNFTEDLMIRITKFPLKQYEYLNMNFVDFIIGVGFGPNSGALGLPSIPNAHNNFVEMLNSGGILFLSSFFLLLSKSIYIFVKNMDYNTSIVGIIIIIIFVINMLIGASNIYQPINCVIIFTLIKTGMEKN